MIKKRLINLLNKCDNFIRMNRPNRKIARKNCKLSTFEVDYCLYVRFDLQ